MTCGLRLGGTGADCFDGSNGNYWRREQFAGAGDVLGTFTAGEQAIVADAVASRGQHVHQETADELVGGERHDLVPLGTFDPGLLLALLRPWTDDLPKVRLPEAIRTLS